MGDPAWYLFHVEHPLSVFVEREQVVLSFGKFPAPK